MFSSGLFSTFIPEILMVIGYVFCIFSPNLPAQTPKSLNNEQHKISIDFKNEILSAYQVEFTVLNDFQCIVTQETVQNSISTPIIKLLPETLCFTVNNLFGFSHYSRPPPVLYC